MPEEPSLESHWAALRMALGFERITEHNQKSIFSYLTILQMRDENTFKHVVRVGLTSRKAAKFYCMPGITPKMMMWAGLLHDVGKALIDRDILQKTVNFTPEDMAAMEPHVQLGWQLLERVHDVSAHIIVRHHQFGLKPYPKELPPLPEYLAPKREMIEDAARLLSLVDYYDAITTRNNDKFDAPLTPEQRKEAFIANNADLSELATILIEKGIFKFD
jgi:putative nucleotidyltransferase with HDIG domain